MLWCGSCEPSYWCKYVHVNIKSANGQALSREAALPDYARGRPDTVVKLLRERHDRGSMMSIACQPGQEVGQFWVEKSDSTLRAMHNSRLCGRAHAAVHCSVPLYIRGKWLRFHRASNLFSRTMLVRYIHIPLPSSRALRGRRGATRWTSRGVSAAALTTSATSIHASTCSGHQPEWTFGHLPACLRDQPRLLIDMVVVGEAAPAAHEAGPPPPPPPPATSPPPGILHHLRVVRNAPLSGL